MDIGFRIQDIVILMLPSIFGRRESIHEAFRQWLSAPDSPLGVRGERRFAPSVDYETANKQRKTHFN